MGQLDQIKQAIDELTEREAAELAQVLEEKWGVSAAAAVAVAAAPGGAAAPAAEEQTEFTVILKAGGDKKINVIKEVRAITGLGLREAKDLVEAGGRPVKEGVEEGVDRTTAAQISRQITEAGGTVAVISGSVVYPEPKPPVSGGHVFLKGAISPEQTMAIVAGSGKPAHTPDAAESNDDFSEGEWDEIMRRALLIVEERQLDSAAHHLAYIRDKLSAIGAIDVWSREDSEGRGGAR